MGNEQVKEPVDSVGGFLLDTKNEARMKAIFDKYDADKSGQLDAAEFKKFYTEVVREALNADPAKKQAAEAQPELFNGLFEIGASFSFELCDRDGSKTISFQEFKSNMPAILAKTKEQYKKDVSKYQKKK